MADVAVIVPVMRRPQNAASFMASLRASTAGLGRTVKVYVLADAGDIDTKEAWRSAGADEVGTGTLGTFAKKVNEGYRISQEPWLFITGDDVRFHPGWLDTALQTAEHTGAKVVGTNDLGNPRVMSGQHGTHLLIARSYVDELGASWDGPGVVCHEGYRHWYVDDEIVRCAKQRGVWASASGAVVEHLHPIFGKAPVDEVYLLGMSWAAVDETLFERRSAEHAAVPA